MVSKSLRLRCVPKKRLIGSISTGRHDSTVTRCSADQRLQHPRGHAVAAAGRLHRWLHQQHALHGAGTSAVASASSDRIAVTP